MTWSPPRRGDQLARRVEGHDLAVIDDGDAVAEPLGFVHVMRGEQHSAAGLAEAADDVPELAARLRIEAGRRFVEKQQLRIADEGTGHGQPLLLSAGEIADPANWLFPQAKPGPWPARARCLADRSCERA